MKVLIGYDGSDCANRAIDELQRAGLPGKMEAMVLSVADVWPHLPEQQYGALDPSGVEALPLSAQRVHLLAVKALDEARALAARGADRVAQQFRAARVHAEACADSPAWALIRKSEEWGADLLVVGSQGRSALGRLVLGSVSQSVVTQASCSVRVGRCPSGGSGSGPIRLVIGIDGSADAAAAVRAVGQRNWPAGTEARVVIALDTAISTVLPSIGGPVGEEGAVTGLYQDEPDWVHTEAEAGAEQLRAAGLAATPVVLHGDPKRVLLEQSSQWPADCVFLGARGRSRVERMLLGSVSAAVAARAACSVEVVRPVIPG